MYISELHQSSFFILFNDLDLHVKFCSANSTCDYVMFMMYVNVRHTKHATQCATYEHAVQQVDSVSRMCLSVQRHDRRLRRDVVS